MHFLLCPLDDKISRLKLTSSRTFENQTEMSEMSLWGGVKTIKLFIERTICIYMYDPRTCFLLFSCLCL